MLQSATQRTRILKSHHLVKIFVRHKRESKLRRGSNDACWATFEQRFEAFFAICC